MKDLIIGFRTLLILTVITGVLYPGVVSGLAQMLFPAQANGSLVRVDDKVVGSTLIGQQFKSPEYFHPRPSAAGADGYDASLSSGSNLGPTNKKLHDRVREGVDAFRERNPQHEGPVPVDLVTTSASGLDPHISPEAARAQAARVAMARSVPIDRILSLIAEHTEQPDLGFIGEPRVNVLQLNLVLQQMNR